MFRKILLLISVVFIVYSLAGCQTVQGLGEDIKSVGEAGEAALK